MSSARAVAVILVATGLLAADTAMGQALSPNGNLYGTARDIQEQSVPGVTVSLTGPGAARTATSDMKGDFRFLDLSPGDYAIRLERKGLETVRRDVTIVPGRNAVLSIAMPV